MKRVTIQDIADELGFSRNTVSKAINNSEGLADATRKRIFEKAVEMGYKQFSYIKERSSAAPEPEAQRKEKIALLDGYAASSSHYTALMQEKLKRDLSHRGYVMNAYRINRESVLHRTLPLGFDPTQVKAIICFEIFDRTYGEMICSLGLPVLFVDGPNKRDGVDLPADQLYMDSTTVITRFINSMLARGKQKIGFIGDYERCQSFFERYTAFRYTMLMANAPVDERFCIKTCNREKLEDVLSSLTEFPDVFICVNDSAASETFSILRRLGKSVPGDVLLCGYDDSPVSRVMTPALTTVHIHVKVMAAAAEQLVLSRINEPNLNYRIVHTETELVCRDSTRT